MSLNPDMFVARSTKMVADSIGAIDQQIVALQAVHVDSNAIPNLSSDLSRLDSLIEQWKNNLRSVMIDDLSEALLLNSKISTIWASVDQQNSEAMLTFAEKLKLLISAEDDTVLRLSAAVVEFRTAIDQSVASLQIDLNTVSEKLNSELNIVQMLRSQVQKQQEKIDYYKRNPWKLILDCVSIIALIEDLQNIIESENQAQSALSQLQEVQRQVQSLADTRSSLLGLSIAMTGLSGGISNVQTAISQIANTLNDILQEPPILVILSAQLNTMVEDLSTAQKIMAEILGNT